MPKSMERGALTEAVLYILLSLYSPLHGYGIMQNVSELSGGRVVLGAGTLYGAINTLVEKNWIEPLEGAAGNRRKEYMITNTGKAAVAQEIVRLEELLRNATKIAAGGLK
jgi:DNA-binding PadR family transcriptional regulator